MTESQIEIRARQINNEIDELRKERTILNETHVYNLLNVVNDILWFAQGKDLPKEAVAKMQTIIIHLLNFMGGNIPNTFPDFLDYKEQIRQMILERTK